MAFHRIHSYTAAAILSTAPLGAQVLLQYDFNGLNAAIPDASLSGLVDSRSITTTQDRILSITVGLTIEGVGAGAFNGDLYAYLSHDSGIAILLNRPGKTVGNPFGYEDNGFSVTFDDSAPNGDVHSYQTTVIPSSNGMLTGIWAPDGRNADPATVLDSNPRTATLDSFVGMNPNGNWNLFVADLSGGGTAQLTGWSMSITAVPEPQTYAMAAGSLLVAFAFWRKVSPARR